ncbi:MAG: bifunctional pyr operon transcriptional regulator/uracil phosphoribosyltransferase PyrR [Phycisphaeraceae bacterium]|nr:bifunctional pyr operon transcriptional regulator/uracil phosphoribosyltransferase PyrR [Phycisphaeraceae bacterium]
MKPLADEAGVDALIEALSKDILALTGDRSKLAMIGIRRRGDVLAARLAQKLGVKDVGSIDITLYRDDLSETGAGAKVGRTDLPFDVNGRDVVLCDDVIMTGRSVLAAIREIVDFGRPKRLRLAVLVARPERELPIQPDHAGIRVSPGPDEKIDVRLKGQDDVEGVWLNTKG